MAYHLKAGEPVPLGIRRIVGEEIAAAVEGLTGAGAARDEPIHEARKSVKKIRAVLRLARPELGAAYKTENARLREAGRALSPFRDAVVMIETLGALRARYEEQAGDRVFNIARRVLLDRKTRAERELNIERAVNRAAGILRGTARRLRSWGLEKDGFAALAEGLKNTVRRGRKALRMARREPAPEHFHELRKRAKDHWYHVRLFEDCWNDGLASYEKSLKELETLLGDDHNLAVLRALVRAEPEAYGGEADRLAAMIDAYQGELQTAALALGAGIYSEQPREFTKTMKHLWQARRIGPETVSKSAGKADSARRSKAPQTAA